MYSAWRTVVTRGSGSEVGVRVGRNGEFQNGGLYFCELGGIINEKENGEVWLDYIPQANILKTTKSS